nr:uncharacterized protein LOC109192518 [Ipomoea batatas]
MESRNEVAENEIDRLERGLLDDEDNEPAVYTASFKEAEENFVKYQTAQWVTRQVPFPCFGVLKREKYVLLHSVADIVVEQGYLQSLFGVYSIRIENVGVRRPPSDDLKIHGVANPCAFKKACFISDLVLSFYTK